VIVKTSYYFFSTDINVWGGFGRPSNLRLLLECCYKRKTRNTVHLVRYTEYHRKAEGIC